jgi:hypothetical protein
MKLYNNYIETRNLIGQYPCRVSQSCKENLDAFRGLFKMSDNKNISMREINNNSILNERQVHQNSEQRFTITADFVYISHFTNVKFPLYLCIFGVNEHDLESGIEIFASKLYFFTRKLK